MTMSSKDLYSDTTAKFDFIFEDFFGRKIVAAVYCPLGEFFSLSVTSTRSVFVRHSM